MRQHTTAYVCIRQHALVILNSSHCCFLGRRVFCYLYKHTSAYVSMRQLLTSAYVSIRQHTLIAVSLAFAFSAS
jgi:hypothetical protein